MDEAWDAVGESRPVAPVDDGPGAAGYAAIASAFLRAISGSKDEVVTLNVANDGRLPFLDDDAVVEVPCTVSRSGIRPRPVGPLRHPQAELVARVKDVERTTIRAAIERSRALALQALAGHPIVPSLSVAQRILDEYLAASPELRTALT